MSEDRRRYHAILVETFVGGAVQETEIGVFRDHREYARGIASTVYAEQRRDVDHPFRFWPGDRAHWVIERRECLAGCDT